MPPRTERHTEFRQNPDRSGGRLSPRRMLEAVGRRLKDTREALAKGADSLLSPTLPPIGLESAPAVIQPQSESRATPKDILIHQHEHFAKRRTEHPRTGAILLPGKSHSDDWYLSEHADSRFFPSKVPLGERAGIWLRIPYRGITKLFMGSAREQAEKITKKPGKIEKLINRFRNRADDHKITKAVERAVDEALTPPQPHRYRVGMGLRYGVRNIVKPIVEGFGLIPGVEALAWDVPSAIGSALQGKGREAFMTLALATLDFTPAALAAFSAFLGVATGGVGFLGTAAIASAGFLIGWLTEWRYFHPYIRKHYADRDEGAMQKMLNSFENQNFVQNRHNVPARLWAREFPDQTRYAVGIAKYGMKDRRITAEKLNTLKATHDELTNNLPQFKREYNEKKLQVEQVLERTKGEKPRWWQRKLRKQFNNAYNDMLDAYESIKQFERVERMHNLLFNAYATRNVARPELLAIDRAAYASRRG